MTTTDKVYTLNKAMYPNMMRYSPDGFGRDKYIHHDNGGFWKDDYQTISLPDKYDVPKYRNYHSLRKNVASVTYHSDGSGRDTYVIHESGGLEKEYTSLKHFDLNVFLRSPNSGNFNFRSSPMKEGVSHKTPYISKQEFNTNKRIKLLEKGLLNRLYYSEKHKFSPNSNSLKSSKISLPPLLTEVKCNEDKKMKNSNLIPLTPQFEVCPKFTEKFSKANSLSKFKLKYDYDGLKNFEKDSNK